MQNDVRFSQEPKGLTYRNIATHLESTVELAVLGIHRLGAQLVHAGVQGHPEVIGEALAQVLKNRDQRRFQENPGVVKVYRFRGKERHARRGYIEFGRPV